MGGINITSSIAGLEELIASVEDMRSEIVEALSLDLAAQVILYDKELLGSGPGAGLTPFDTGRLLSSGNSVQDGINLVFENDTEYASWAHKSRKDPSAKDSATGGYQRTSGSAFEDHFGDALTDLWDETVQSYLDKP